MKTSFYHTKLPFRSTGIKSVRNKGIDWRLSHGKCSEFVYAKRNSVMSVLEFGSVCLKRAWMNMILCVL